jgi:hypothetical protein
MRIGVLITSSKPIAMANEFNLSSINKPDGCVYVVVR